MGAPHVSRALHEVYRRLLAGYGPQHWWPAETPFEVMVGAILTQSAAWVNVEKAIQNLKRAGDLSPAALRSLSREELAGLIRPSGYYNAKAAKLKALAEWLGKYGDDLERVWAKSLEELRGELLTVHGIGPETADSILLYAGGKPVFVVDAYTRRILGRLGLAPGGDSYPAYQALFMENLPRDPRIFNEFHALLVQLGKRVCRPAPLCPQCYLKEVCRYCQKTTPEVIQ